MEMPTQNPALAEIKIRRKKLNLTQSQLAKQAAISQSIIAKIEKSRADPAYSTVTKIISALDKLESKSAKKVEDLMIKKIIAAKPSDKIRSVVQRMKKHEISQMPVISKEGKVLGLITEKIIMDALLSEEPKIVKISKAEERMEEIPPSVPYGSPVTQIIPLLDNFPCILVVKRGEVKGLLTKSDIIREFC